MLKHVKDPINTGMFTIYHLEQDFATIHCMLANPLKLEYIISTQYGCRALTNWDVRPSRMDLP